MKSKSALVLAAVVALIASFLGATSAGATGTTPPWYPDSNSRGHVSFYDSSGHQITSGSPNSGYPLSYFAAYAAADSDSPSVALNKATMFVGIPDSSKSNTLAWTAVQLSGSPTFPIGSAPSPLSTLTSPVVSLSSQGGDADLASVISSATLSSTAGYVGLLQIRIKISGQGQTTPTYYWETTISFDSGTGSWAQVYPAPPQLTATTVSTPTSSPAPVGGKLPHQTDVTLSTVVSEAANGSVHPDGTVVFTDEHTSPPVTLGTATYDTATGSASLAIGKPADGAHKYVATFTPTDTATYSSSYNDIGSVDTPPLIVVVAPLPTVYAPPAINGTAKVGSVLSCTTGTWSNASTYTYDWFQGASAATATTKFASGSTSGTLVAALANKYVTCKVTGANISGSVVSSPATAVKVALGAAAVVGTPKPKITGTSRVGKVLTASPGKWSPTATYTYTYVWKRYKAGNKGASVVLKAVAKHADQYKAVAADKGKYIFLVVTATRAGYAASNAYITAPVKIA